MRLSRLLATRARGKLCAYELRFVGATLDAGRRARESRRRGRLLARKPRRVEKHSAPARPRPAPLTNGRRDAGRVTVGCSPRKRHGAVS
jgi:hypothetical protein